MAYARVGEYKKMQQVQSTICVLIILMCLFLSILLLMPFHVIYNLPEKLSWVNVEVVLYVGFYRKA